MLWLTEVLDLNIQFVCQIEILYSNSKESYTGLSSECE